MRTLLSVGAVIIAVLAMDPQRRDACNVEIITTPGTVSHVTRLPDGGRRIDAGGGVEATCGDKHVRADSASYLESQGVLHLFRNFRFRDPRRTLEAQRATYYRDEDRLHAEGDVSLTDVESGSTLKGPLLDYYPANARRPVERIFAPERPHLQFYPGGAGAAANRGEAFDVDGDRIHIYGDSALAAAGRVVAIRQDLEATADSMNLDLTLDELWLLGDPEVVANQTSLEGDTILILLENQQVREIRAWPHASARSEDLTLTAPSLRLFADAGEIVRTVAAPGEPERTGAVDSAGREPWAYSRSTLYTLVADSIEIKRPAGRLDRVIAVERARAESLAPVAPEEGVLGRNWIEGDTVTGFFTQPDTSSGEAEEAELSRLISVGHARALYYLLDEQAADGPPCPAINYVIGEVITLWLEAGEVREGEVVGPATGLYDEPQETCGGESEPAADTTGGAGPTPPDTAVADTARSAGGGRR
jgi:lipopolysaccharide export system protein LptA